MTKNQVDINEVIREKYIVPESVFDRKRTKTSHFMLNTIFPNNSITGTEHFINAFIGDDEYIHEILRPIFILFKTLPKDNKWGILHQRLRTKAEYVTEYFCGIQNGKELIMLVFQVPEKYAKEYTNFLTGRYSKFSEEYKKLFIRHTYDEKSQPIESTIWRVVYKSDVLKKELETYFDVEMAPEDELWGIPEPKFEIYRYNE